MHHHTLKIFILLVSAVLSVLVLTHPSPANAEDRLPLATGICVNKAQGLIQQGKIPEAIKVLEDFRKKAGEVSEKAAVQKGYTHYYVDFMLGNTCLMYTETAAKGQNQFLKRAASAYESAVSKEKELSPAWLNLAKCRYDLGQMQKAADAFKKGYETCEEKKASHLYYAAICYFQADAHQKALKTFYKLMASHPKEITLDWKESLVSILFAMDRNKEALPVVETLAAQCKAEKRKKWQEILLYQYLELKMDKKALKYGEFLTRTDPLEPKWWKAVSHLHLNRNELKKGLTSLLIYSYLTPPSPEETSLMADLYLSLEIPSKAADYYEELLREKPNFEKIKRIIHAYTGSYQRDKALAWIERGLSWKRDADLLKRKASLLYEMERYKEAADVYEALAKQNDKTGEHLLMLGYCAWNMKQFDRAGKAFNLACGYKNQKKSAQQAIAQLNMLKVR
ncbi:tetratricopeptide repeat protein [Desulfocicer niacini]